MRKIFLSALLLFPALALAQVQITGSAVQVGGSTASAGVSSAQGTSPIQVNGLSGTPASGDITIACPSCGQGNFQYNYTQQGTGQYVLVPFTSSGCSATTGGSAGYINGSYGPPLVLSSGGFFITGGQNGSCTFSNPVLPSGVTTGQITAIYAVGWKAETNFDNANPTEVGHLSFSGTSIGGGAVLRIGSAGGMGPTPFQYGLQLTGTFANFSTITATAAGATNPFSGGGGLYYATALEVDYTGTPVTQSGTVNLGPGFGWDPSTDTLSLLPFAIYPISVNSMKGLPAQTANTYNLVIDGATSADCATGGGSNTVWCKADGSGGFTGFPFGGSGGSAITALTGDVNATGPGSAAATVVKVNNGAIPTSQPCVGTNSSGQFVDGSCGGGGGGGISDPTVINLTAAPYYASPYGATTTTGTFSASATSGTVGSCSNFVANNGVLIVGGASNGWTGTDYIGTVVSCTGTTMTITPAITNAVSGHVVQHDETAAFTAAITALTAGGVIVLPNASSTTQGIYLVNGPLQNTGTANAILQMPTINSGLANPNIKIEGFTTWFSSPIIQTSLSTSSAALFGAYGPVSPHLTGVGLWFKNVQIFGPASGSATMIDGTNMQALSFEGSVRVQAATSGIATTGKGVLFPSIANNVALTVSGILGVSGFGTAVRLGEHSAGLDILVSNSQNGMVFDVAPNGMAGDNTPNSISVQHVWCGPPSSGPTTVSNCLVAGTTATTIHVADVDYEGTGGTLINDPSNLLHGDVNYALNNTASCPTSPTLSGATNLALMSLNCVAGGTKTVTTGSVTNNHYAAFNADGSIKDGGGAVGPTIVAGTGVTINEGSPCSSGDCTINASGGGGGDFVKIASVIASSTNTMSFTSIPGTYANLELDCNGAISSGTDPDIWVQFNGDTGSNYDWVSNYNGSNAAGNGTNHPLIISMSPAPGSPTNASGGGTIFIPNYANTTFLKSANTFGSRRGSETNIIQFSQAVTWHSTAAITQINLVTDGSNNYVNGSTCTLYGKN